MGWVDKIDDTTNDEIVAENGSKFKNRQEGTSQHIEKRADGRD